MKLILLIICLFITGCEKKLEVNHLSDGYISEEIANVELTYNGELFVSQTFDLIDENHIQFFVDMIDENDKNRNACYHINIENKTFEKGPYILIQDELLWDTPHEETENGILVLEKEDYRIYFKSENIYETNEYGDRYSIGTHNAFYYEKDGKLTLLCEYERISKTAHLYILPIQDAFYNEKEKQGYILCPNEEDVVLYSIQDGYVEKVHEYPYIQEGFKLDSMKVVDGKEQAFYKGKESMMYVQRDKHCEYSYKANVLITDEYVFVHENDDMNAYVKSYISNLNTNEINEYQEEIPVNKMKKVYSNVFECEDLNSPYEEKTIYRLNDDFSLTCYHLPFTSGFEYLWINENQFVTYSNNTIDEQLIYTFYLVTLK